MKINKIKIQHTEGLRSNQLDTFDFKKYDQINLGRSSDCQVIFDTNAPGVSRNHATINKKDAKGNFTIVDNNSINGVYVNGEKIESEAAIFPGDTIQLGLKGPKFTFDLDPRPVGLAATKLMEVLPATQELEIEAASAAPTPKGIGKETFERAIEVERKKSNFNLIATVFSLLIVLAATGFTFKDQIFGGSDPIGLPAPPPPPPPEITASDIAEANTSKVVLIETAWKLRHAQFGEDIHHEYSIYEDPQSKQKYNLPLYVQLKDGSIEPVLGLAKDVPNGKPIVGAGSGTGFVIDERGHIMTNKHVSSSWKNSPYNFPDREGLLMKIEKGQWVIAGIINSPTNWIPSRTKMFEREPIMGQALTAETMYLDVTFSKTSQRTKASITRESQEHDLAILKVDLIGDVIPVDFAPYDYEVKIGQEVISLGFPGISPDLVKRTKDESDQSSTYKVVPNPTLADGMISKVMNSSGDASLSNENDIFSFAGDLYQMTINTGSGNSGGPVFNDKGEVIAIINSVRADFTATKFTYAIPIKYALSLMSTQTVIK